MTQTFVPTDEQNIIVDASVTTKDNLRLIAYAGAAKTSTLDLIAKANSKIPILYIVFNKANADEAKKRLPGNVEPRTFNSIGHMAWGTGQGKRLALNARKTGDHLKRAIEALPKKQQWDYWDQMGDIIKMIDRAKVQGYVPHGKFAGSKPLVTRDEFEASFDDPIPGGVLRLVDQALSTIITASYGGEIDFSDQIYMPVVFGGAFSRFPLVLVDESQDLSPINHAMLRKLVTQRIICVGDPYQSIYGFRGAIHSGMDRLAEQFTMRDMRLSTSFRCPKEIVRHAHRRVPDMKWAPWAIDGEVHAPTSWDPGVVPDGSAIICRHNAPLLSLGFKLIRAGRGVSITGHDIGPGLVKTFEKLGPETMTQKEVYDAIDRWETDQLNRTRAAASTADRAECFRIFASQGGNRKEALGYAKHIFATSGPIKLLSGHKSKGLEWPTVFHLDPHRCKPRNTQTPEEREQERNIEYVITTRAKEHLWLVNSEDFNG
jgi:DNA helicase II / ATP-dependent DNA helicase PcrA